MTKFQTKQGPYLRDKTSLTTMTTSTYRSLAVIILSTLIQNIFVSLDRGITNFVILLQPLITVIVCITITYVTNIVIIHIFLKEKLKLGYQPLNSLLLGLFIPRFFPISLTIIVSIIMEVGELVIFKFRLRNLNPLIWCLIFIFIIDGKLVLLGNCSFLCLLIIFLSLLYLAKCNVLKWRFSLSYFFGLILFTLVGDAISFGNYSVSLSLLFSQAPLLVSYPIIRFYTIPYHPKTQILAGLLGSLITIILLPFVHVSLGILISILIINILTPLINKYYLRINFIRECQYALYTILIILILLSSYTINIIA